MKVDLGNGSSVVYTYDAAGNRLSAVTAPPNDNFADRILLAGASDSDGGHNTGGTRQPVEPQIANNRGGASVWYSWTAPTAGYTSVSTAGSSFDTLLAVYTGSSVGALSLVAADDNRGGNNTSLLTFIARAGTTYHIAIDGRNGATGNYYLRVSPAAPQITAQPQSKQVLIGSTLVLSAGAIGDGTLQFQWYRNGIAVTGATNSTLTLSNAQPANGGTYTVVVSNAAGSTTSAAVVVAVHDPEALATVYQQSNDQHLSSWLVYSNQVIAAALIRNGQPAASGWRMFGQGNFDNDSKIDIAFQNSVSGKLSFWSLDGTTFLGSELLRGGLAPALSWRAVAAADFNYDAKPDVLLHNIDGRISVWFMEGTNFLGSTLLRNGVSAGAGWTVVGTGDFDWNGQSDIVLQHVDGRIVVWRFFGASFIGSTQLRTGPPQSTGWTIRGVGDFNQDSKPDLLWQHANGKTIIWFFDNMQSMGSAPFKTAGPGWMITGPR